MPSTISTFAASRFAILILLLLLLATGLRFHKLDAQSFWNDEGNSARLSERSLPLIIEGTASDVHPPLYYLLLRGWRELLGESEFGLRSFSAFAGILTVAATITLAHLWLRRHRQNGITGVGAVLAAGLLAAVNPALIYYSQETRMYSLLALLTALSTISLVRWLHAQRKLSWALAYVFFSTAGLYTHYFYPAVFIFQGLIVLLWMMRQYITLAFAPLQLAAEPHWARMPLHWLGMVGISFTLYLPWAPVFLRQTTGRTAERAALPSFLWDSLRWMTFGETISAGDLIWITLVVILLLIWAVLINRRRVLLPFFGVAVPLAAMYLAGATNPAFFKFIIITIPFYLIWLASSFAPEKLQKRAQAFKLGAAGSLLLIPILLGMAASLRNLYNDPSYARADYRYMAEAIAAAEDTNAGIILTAPNQWEVFTYYHQPGAPVYPLPKGQPDPQILEPQLAEIAERHNRIYALYWGEEQRDPERVIETWLDENSFKASETWVGDVRFVVYSTSAPAGEIESVLQVNFDGKITLLGATIDGNLFAPGDIIQISLFWSAEAPLDQRYKTFIHLVDDNGVIVAQQDSEPVGGMAPTTAWQPGEIIRDNQGVLLPADLEPGEYDLLVGLYELDDPGKRLPVQNAAGVQDFVLLGKIEAE